MDNYEEAFKKTKEEFETYQSFAESTIQMLSEKNNTLEKKLDALSNIVEVSKYINSNISDDNLISMINDMIIGILGVIYSSIYLKESGKLISKASNKPDFEDIDFGNEVFQSLKEGEPFVINCKKLIFDNKINIGIHSLVGVPIYIRNKYIGYIIVEHSLCDFFNHEHIKFISSIANQIGIAIENNNLYNKVRENSIRDPLLGIYNRKYFFDVVEEKIQKNPNKKFGIVMLDLDNFKRINDIYGHQIGDKILINTSKVIASNISSEDILSRYGGEELIVYLDNVEDEGIVFHNINSIRMLLGKSKISLNGVVCSITASFGLSFYPTSADTLPRVINVADVMLYEAKRAGKNKVVSG